jgi:hypothetical protein
VAGELIGELAGPRQLKEPGSLAWCVQTLQYLKAHIRHVDEQWVQAQQVYDELLRYKAWKVVPPGRPYGTLNKMLKAEVGLDDRAIKARIREAELAARGTNRDPVTGQWHRVDNINAVQGGTSEAYTFRRLRRDHPDLAERVEQGELSAHAAAIEAGFRHPTVSVPLDDLNAAARALRRRMNPGQLFELVRILQIEGLGDGTDGAGSVRTGESRRTVH